MQYILSFQVGLESSPFLTPLVNFIWRLLLHPQYCDLCELFILVFSTWQPPLAFLIPDLLAS